MRLRVLAHVLATFAFCEVVSGNYLYFVESKAHGVAGVDGMVWPTKVVVSPDGRNVYAAALASSAVAVFRRDATTGALTFVEAQTPTVWRSVPTVSTSTRSAHTATP